MPLSQVALVVGFGSIRRFNAVFQALIAVAREVSCCGDADAGSALTLTLPFAPPYDWPAMLAHACRTRR